jgi:hypothetical protein
MFVCVWGGHILAPYSSVKNFEIWPNQGSLLQKNQKDIFRFEIWFILHFLLKIPFMPTADYK